MKLTRAKSDVIAEMRALLELGDLDGANKVSTTYKVELVSEAKALKDAEAAKYEATKAENEAAKKSLEGHMAKVFGDKVSAEAFEVFRRNIGEDKTITIVIPLANVSGSLVQYGHRAPPKGERVKGSKGSLYASLRKGGKHKDIFGESPDESFDRLASPEHRVTLEGLDPHNERYTFKVKMFSLWVEQGLLAPISAS